MVTTTLNVRITQAMLENAKDIEKVLETAAKAALRGAGAAGWAMGTVELYFLIEDMYEDIREGSPTVLPGYMSEALQDIVSQYPCVAAFHYEAYASKSHEIDPAISLVSIYAPETVKNEIPPFLPHEDNRPPIAGGLQVTHDMMGIKLEEFPVDTGYNRPLVDGVDVTHLEKDIVIPFPTLSNPQQFFNLILAEIETKKHKGVHADKGFVKLKDEQGQIIGQFTYTKDHDTGDIELDLISINDEYLSQGYGSVALNEFAHILHHQNDENEIHVNASPFGHHTLNLNKLIGWYEKHLGVRLVDKYPAADLAFLEGRYPNPSIEKSSNKAEEYRKEHNVVVDENFR